MKSWFANIVNHPATSIVGILTAILTISGVLLGQGVTLGHLGSGSVVGLIAALASALLGLLSKDPGKQPVQENLVSNVKKADTGDPIRCK